MSGPGQADGGGARRIEGVSAVVCNYNGAEYLDGCLRAILAQGGVDEVLVVDDASTDGSVALVHERFPDVRVLELERNQGPAAVRNAGMRAARHRFVLAVDNDAVLAPDVCAKLRAALEGRPDAVAAQTRNVHDHEPDRVHYDGGRFHYVGLLSLRNFYAPLAQAEGVGVVDADGLIAICILLDREVVLAAGGYDEAYFILYEDYELAYRLRLAGHALLSVEDAIVRHRGGTKGISFRGGGYPGRRAFLHSHNRWRVIAKCYAVRTLLVALPGILAYELVWLAFVLLQGHLLDHLRGKRAFLGSLGEVRALRRAVQASRVVPDRELVVGGPLTLSPSLVEAAPARLAARALDLCLRAWWSLARPFSG